jgi:hypothetical protein
MNIKTWNSGNFVIRKRSYIILALIIIISLMTGRTDADKEHQERQKVFAAYLRCAMSALNSDHDGYVSDLDRIQASRDVVEAYKRGGDLEQLFECKPQGGLKKK